MLTDPELTKRLQAYRAKLIKAGKLLEARAVAQCIEIIKTELLCRKDLSTSAAESDDRPSCNKVPKPAGRLAL